MAANQADLMKNVGDTFSINIIATDANAGDTISYGMSVPTTASFLTLTGNTITSGTLATANAGSYAVTATACDQHNACATQTFTIVVN